MTALHLRFVFLRIYALNVESTPREKFSKCEKNQINAVILSASEESPAWQGQKKSNLLFREFADSIYLHTQILPYTSFSFRLFSTFCSVSAGSSLLTSSFWHEACRAVSKFAKRSKI